jgi:signal transduction histidine kinase
MGRPFGCYHHRLVRLRSAWSGARTVAGIAMRSEDVPVSARAVRRVSWTTFAVAMAMNVAAVVLLILARSASFAGGFGFRGFAAILAVAFGSVGAIVASRQPRNPIGWIFLALALVAAFQELVYEYALYALPVARPPLTGGLVCAWINAWIWVLPTAGISSVFLLFPNGRPVTARWWWVVAAMAIGALVAAAGFALTPGALQTGSVVNPYGVGARSAVLGVAEVGLLLYFAAMIAGLASLVVRLRRTRGDEREQVRWLAAAAAFVVIASVVVFGSFAANPGRQNAGLYLVASVIQIVAFGAIPVATGIGILKYRLYDIDIVISKAVVYGVLAAFASAVYVAVVVGIGALVGRTGGSNLGLSVAATAIVAVAFQPIRDRARHLANRFVYGNRATPYEVLSEFAEGLAGTYSIDHILPRMAELLATGIGAVDVQIWLRVGGELRPAATWPEEPDRPRGAPVPFDGEQLPAFHGADRRVPVRHLGEVVGAIAVTVPPNEPLDPARERLVQDVAAQAGLVLRNARLIEELRASRQRLVTAQDGERRRLERNIHDGAQQQLVSLAVKLRLAESLLTKDPQQLQPMLVELQAQAGETLQDLRDLARGIYPPLLADKGLAAALESQARRAPVPVRIDADGVGRFSQDVEAAVYFCSLEALQNATKYAAAPSVRIELRASGSTLSFSVTDDGRGFDPATTPPGSGLTNMADRLAALGGSIEVRSAPGRGTTVVGKLPAVSRP